MMLMRRVWQSWMVRTLKKLRLLFPHREKVYENYIESELVQDSKRKNEYLLYLWSPSAQYSG